MYSQSVRPAGEGADSVDGGGRGVQEEEEEEEESHDMKKKTRVWGIGMGNSSCTPFSFHSMPGQIKCTGVSTAARASSSASEGAIGA